VRLGAHIAFVDESGFLLIPPVRRTWGPRGRPPVTRYSYKHDRISAISALTASPRRHRIGLYFQLHRKNIQQAEVRRFLRYLLRHLRGHIIVIWDNARPHKGDPIRRLCRRVRRLHLERFPAYAPELNPDEGVWNQADNSLANGRPDHLDRLSTALTRVLRHMRKSQRHLRWCVHQSSLPLFCADSCIIYAEIYNCCGRSYSHSMVAGGLFVMSYTTRFTSRTSLVILVDILSSISHGSFAKFAVIASVDSSILTTTGFL
jgi:transposase